MIILIKKDKSMLNMICYYFCCDVKNCLLGKKNLV